MVMPICETCGGGGWVPTSVAVCCGNPTPHGECCDNPVEEQQQGECPDCGGRGLYGPEPQIQGNER